MVYALTPWRIADAQAVKGFQCLCIVVYDLFLIVALWMLTTTLIVANVNDEAAIDYRFLRDVYVVIGDQQDDGGWVMRTYIKPLANGIGGGCILRAMGGLFSLSDRRFRVAAGARKAPAGGVPAE